MEAVAPKGRVGCTMANKETNTSSQPKKQGKTLKEKRVAKAAKQDEKTAARKSWEK